MRFSRAWFTVDSNLEWFEASLLTEFIFDLLNISLKTLFTMPVESFIIIICFLLIVSIIITTTCLGYKQWTWLDFDVEHHKSTPIEI